MFACFGIKVIQTQPKHFNLILERSSRLLAFYLNKIFTIFGTFFKTVLNYLTVQIKLFFTAATETWTNDIFLLMHVYVKQNQTNENVTSMDPWFRVIECVLRSANTS